MKRKQTHTISLINRCQKKDKRAQLELYNLYYKSMYNTAYRILNNEFEAEDVVQEAFLSVFTQIDQLRDKATFGGWLKRIVINKSLSELRIKKKMEIVSMELVSEIEEQEPINYEKLQISTVISCLNTLKDNYRVVLNLNLIEGYDYEEIAQILGYTNENVRAITSRAKRKLKTLLAKL